MKSGFLLLLAITCTTAHSSGQDNRNAENLVAKAVAAQGGAVQLENISSILKKGRFVRGDHSAPLSLHRSKDGKTAMSVSFPIGTLMRTDDGRSAWEVHPLKGHQELSQSERHVMANQTRIAGLAHPDLQVAAPTGKFKDRMDCAAVTPPALPTEHWCFDRETHLPLITRRQVATGPGGPVIVNIEYSDYRPVGSVQLAHRITTSTAVHTIVHQYDEIILNAAAPRDAFKQPQ